jgi:hypothetical protein
MKFYGLIMLFLQLSILADLRGIVVYQMVKWINLGQETSITKGYKKKKGLSHPRSIPILTKYKPV